MKTRKTDLAVLATLILVLVATPPASAKEGEFELSIGAGLTALDDKLGGDTGGSLDLRLGYFVTDRFALELQSVHASSVVDGAFTAHTLNALYHFDVEGDFVPYVLAGVGQAEVEIDELFVPSIEDDSTALRAAIGARFEIGQTGGWFSRVEISALHEDSFDEDATHVSIGILFGWNFGS